MADEALDGPSGCITQRTNGVALDLAADLLQHVDLTLARITLHHARHDTRHPTGALAAGRALATAFMLVEI